MWVIYGNMAERVRVYSQFTAGVLATVAVFVMFFVNLMINKSLGMLLIAMREEFITQTWMLGSVFASILSVSDLLCEY